MRLPRPSRTVSTAWAVVALAACLTVTGCSDAPEPELTALPPVTASVASPTAGAGAPSANETPDCVDGTLRIEGEGKEFDVTGSCPRVEIAGTGLDVDLESASVGRVAVRGDDIDLSFGDVDGVDVEGQDNDLDGRSAGSLTISGNRNSAEVDGVIDSLVIAGQANEVEAGGIESRQVEGEGNRVAEG